MKIIHFQSNQDKKGSVYMTLHWKQSISFIQYLSAFPEMYQFQSMRNNTNKNTPLGLLRTYSERLSIYDSPLKTKY